MSRYHSITKALLYKHFSGLLALDADVEAALGIGYAYALQVVVLDRCVGVISNDVVDAVSVAFVVWRCVKMCDFNVVGEGVSNCGNLMM